MLIQVFRVGDQGALAIAQAVKDYVRDAQVRMPPGVKITTWQDDSEILKARLETLLNDAWQGFVLLLIALALFMQVRTAFWIGMGVHNAILGTLWAMPFFDVLINLLTLFAFLLVLGVLVDDAIVVGENVYTLQAQRRDPLKAAIAGAQEVSTPVMFGVLCSIAAFTPLLTIPGAMGKLTASIPIVVITSLVISLFETQLILPSHLAHAKADAGPPRTMVGRAWGVLQAYTTAGLERFVRRGYTPFLERALAWRS